MPSRADLAGRVAGLADPALQLRGGGSGWPVDAELMVDSRVVPVSLFVSPVGLSHRGRDDSERRFQNPAGGYPLARQPGRVPLLLGVWEDDPRTRGDGTVLVLADAERREGRTTRWSVFVALDCLLEAGSRGWSTHVSNSGERMICFRPELIALAVQAYLSEVDLDNYDVQKSLGATGYFDQTVSDAHTTAGKRRLRRAVTVLVRDARFRGQILEAYERRCAMCALGLSLVQGAHIYPASAPGSSEATSNGIALCANHHLSFDRHQIAVVPRTHEVVFRPDVLDLASCEPSVSRFVEHTQRFLTPPRDRSATPSDEMLHQRYDFFPEEYDWLEHML